MTSLLYMIAVKYQFTTDDPNYLHKSTNQKLQNGKTNNSWKKNGKRKGTFLMWIMLISTSKLLCFGLGCF